MMNKSLETTKYNATTKTKLLFFAKLSETKIQYAEKMISTEFLLSNARRSSQ